MRLFHQLPEEDQHNSVHYCMHLIIDDMLEDGVQIEPSSDEDKQSKITLERVIQDAQKLPAAEQFEFIVTNKEIGSFVFDLALDMARSAYYHEDEDLVIHYESLRHEEHNHASHNHAQHDHEEDINLLMQDINKQPKHNLN